MIIHRVGPCCVVIYKVNLILPDPVIPGVHDLAIGTDDTEQSGTFSNRVIDGGIYPLSFRKPIEDNIQAGIFRCGNAKSIAGYLVYHPIGTSRIINRVRQAIAIIIDKEIEHIILTGKIVDEFFHQDMGADFFNQ